MGCPRHLRSSIAVAWFAGAAWCAQAQGFAADYRLAPAAALGGASGAGLSLQAGRNWFGQVGLGGGTGDVVNLAGGYRWANGQSLSLQLSRGPSQRLGLALNYDWPHYFVRFSYDQGALAPLPQPQENLRFSAGVRF